MLANAASGGTATVRRMTPESVSPRRPRSQPAAPTASRAAPITTAVMVRPRGEFALPVLTMGCTGTADAERNLPCNASANSRAEAKRSAGNFSSAFATAPATCAGTDFRCAVSSFGTSVMTLATIACALGPVNGGSPINISYVTTPSA